MGIAIQLISVLFPNSPMRWKFSGLLCKYPSSKESGQSGVELCHAVDWRSEGHFQLLISMFGQWIFKDLQSWKAKGLWNIPQHATASWTWRSFMIFLRTNKEIWHWKLPDFIHNGFSIQTQKSWHWTSKKFDPNSHWHENSPDNIWKHIKTYGISMYIQGLQPHDLVVFR